MWSVALCFLVVCASLSFWWTWYLKKALREVLQIWHTCQLGLEDKLMVKCQWSLSPQKTYFWPLTIQQYKSFLWQHFTKCQFGKIDAVIKFNLKRSKVSFTWHVYPSLTSQCSAKNVYGPFFNNIAQKQQLDWCVEANSHEAIIQFIISMC